MTRALRLLTLALLLACATAARQLSDGLKQDRIALLSLKDAVTESPNIQTKLASWRPQGNPCFPKPWAYVACSNGRVVSINMANLQLIGSLPRALRRASELVTLDLSGNRLSGNLPSAWADNTVFTKLKTLRLSNNQLTGTLPAFTRRGAWKSLETLDLSNNLYYGGLPASWLNAQKRVLKTVATLDLSNNYLGYETAESSAAVLTKAQWCPAEWDPVTINTAVAGSLVNLDLSSNGIDGELPAAWPKLFVKLEYLMLFGNNLYAAKTPAPLPGTWAAGVQRGFSLLKELVLYPGNENLCMVPTDDNKFNDVNLEAAYKVLDANDQLYDSENQVAPCPTAWTGDNPVSALTLATDKATWTLAGRDASTKDVYGFKVTLTKKDVDLSDIEGSDVYVKVVDAYYNTIFRTYTTSANAQFAAADDGIALALTAGTLTFGTALSAAGDYRITVQTVNLDGVLSSPLSDDLNIP